MALTLFQFHKGTIRTRNATPISRKSRYFNSIKVRLEQLRSTLRTSRVLNFNSIKVRLELDNVDAKDYVGENKFQFHKGTIRTALLANV